MATRATYNWIDHSGEMTRTQLWFEEIEGDGSNYAAVLTSVGLMQAALAVATDLNHVSTSISIETSTSMAAPPATVTAQREIAIRVKMYDATTGKYSHATLGGPIIAFYPPTGVKGDYIPLDNVILAAYILVAEANLVSEDGNAIEIVEARLVGRNS